MAWCSARLLDEAQQRGGFHVATEENTFHRRRRRSRGIHHLIGIAPSNHGTAGLVTPPPDFLPSPTSGPNPACPACEDQSAGSPFLQKLNRIGDVQGPSYTVIATRLDEVATPYQSQFFKGSAKQVTNITIQDKCPADVIEHDRAPKDPVVQQWVANALGVPNGPADPALQPSFL